MKFTLAMAFAAIVAPLAVVANPVARAPSGSQINAFTDDNCNADYFTLKDEPRDGIQGTNCFNTWIRRDNEGGAVYPTIQSIQTENLQEGCAAHIYSNLDCSGDEVLAVWNQQDGNCFRNYGGWFGLSAKITC